MVRIQIRPDTKYEFIKYRIIVIIKLKEEWVSLDVGQDYTSRFNQIYNKIASLCDCKQRKRWMIADLCKQQQKSV